MRVCVCACVSFQLSSSSHTGTLWAPAAGWLSFFFFSLFQLRRCLVLGGHQAGVQTRPSASCLLKHRGRSSLSLGTRGTSGRVPGTYRVASWDHWHPGRREEDGPLGSTAQAGWGRYPAKEALLTSTLSRSHNTLPLWFA